MSKKTRRLAMAAAIIMILSVFAACNPAATPSSQTAPPPASAVQSSAPASSGAAEAEKTGNYPIATPEKPLTLKIWSEMSDIMAKNVKTFEEVYAFQLQEKATGVKIQWEHGVAGQSEEVFNLMLASGDLPDLIRRTIGDPKYPPAKFYNEGIIIDFAPYLEYAPHFSGLLDETAELKKQISDDDGRIFFFPSLQLDVGVRVYRGFMIRQDWLDAVGMSLPKTTDDLYNVLKKWQEADVNGSGINNAFYSANKTDKTDFMLSALLWPFGVDNKYMLKDGEIVFGPTQPEFKQGMEYIRKLYAEGLIDPEYLVNDNAQWESKFLNGEAGAAWGIASRIDKFTQNVDGANFVPVPRLDGPNSTFAVFDTGVTNLYKTNQTVVITTANKHIPETMMWMDWVYSPDGEEAFAIGEEGLTYTMVDGKAKFTELITKDPQGRNQNEVHILYAPGGSQWPCNVTMGQIQVQKNATELKAFETYAANIGDTSKAMPPISLTDAEISAISSALNDIQTESYTWFDNIVLGKATVDQIDTEYIPRLYQMGLQDVLDAYNAAYQRYLNR